MCVGKVIDDCFNLLQTDGDVNDKPFLNLLEKLANLFDN